MANPENLTTPKKGERRNQMDYETRKLISDVRKLSTKSFHAAVEKYSMMGRAKVQEALKDPNLPMMEAMILSVINRAINKGDYRALDFLLDRTIGKVVQPFDFVPPPPPPEPITIDVSAIPTELLRTINGAIKDVTPELSDDQSPEGGASEEGLPRVSEEESGDASETIR